MLCATACFCFFQPAARAQKLGLDARTLMELQEHRNTTRTAVLEKLSNTTQLTTIMLPVTVLAAGLIQNDKATLKKGLYIAESIAVAELVTFGLKYSVKRQRPFEKNNCIISANGGAGSPSFPSGHTSAVFSAATSLTIAYPKWYVAVPAYAWAGSVAFSRMYLGVHYPSDVAAGAIIGAGSAWLCYKANKWLFKKKPSEVIQF